MFKQMFTKKFKLVQFRDGTYGARKWLFLAEPRFLDLKSPASREYCWERGSSYFGCCQGTKAQVEAALNKMYNPPAPDLGTLV